MMGSPSSGSDRQHARNKGLAAISAITLGAGAAGLVGAVGIALTLPSSTSATNGAAGVASNTSTTNDDSGSQLQSGTAPSTTNHPPVATSEAS